MENLIFKCEYCKYTSKRKYNLLRHQNAVHSKNDSEINTRQEGIKSEQNVMPKSDFGIQKTDFGINSTVENNNEKIDKNDTSFNCYKCAKIYKTKKHLIEHEKKCNGLSILTCPKCMKTFSNRHNKSAHIKKNNCKARSIIHAINPESKTINIEGNHNTANMNTINNITNNYINNFGNERTDYITFDDMIKILRLSGDSIIPRYIEFKHFNKDFPENNNIKYEKNNDCLIKKDGEWKITNINNLSTKLIDKNSSEINNYYLEQKNKIEEKIKNIELMEFINKRFNYLDLCIDKKLYKNIKDEIKEIIRSTKI
jgi:uncharacterized C2H2 Zn-finger protein